MILNAILQVRRVKVSDSLRLAHLSLLQKHPAVYPCSRVTSRVHDIPTGSFGTNVPDLFQGFTIPRQIFVLFIPTTTQIGLYDSNPFHYMNMGLKTIELQCGEQKIPATQYNTDMANHNCINLFRRAMDALGFDANTAGPDNYDREAYEQAIFISGFDMTRNGEISNEYINGPWDARAVKLTATWVAPTTVNYTCKNTNHKEYTKFYYIIGITLGIFQSSFEIDSQSRVTTSW